MLREAVTSTGRHHDAALRELERHGVRAALRAAIEAARDRSVELGQTVSRRGSSLTIARRASHEPPLQCARHRSGHDESRCVTGYGRLCRPSEEARYGRCDRKA